MYKTRFRDTLSQQQTANEMEQFYSEHETPETIQAPLGDPHLR
jgi:hypothetical protein